MIKKVQTTTKRYDKLKFILGNKYLKGKIESPFDIFHIAGHGININVVKNFRDYFDISGEDMALMLNISSPTLYRWIKANKDLERNHSIIIVELTELFLYGSEVFGNKENFFKWLNLPNTALGGLEPQNLLEIPGGIAKVSDLLGRIEHGVYS